jgi:hypothetical protein
MQRNQTIGAVPSSKATSVSGGNPGGPGVWSRRDARSDVPLRVSFSTSSVPRFSVASAAIASSLRHSDAGVSREPWTLQTLTLTSTLAHHHIRRREACYGSTATPRLPKPCSLYGYSHATSRSQSYRPERLVAYGAVQMRVQLHLRHRTRPVVHSQSHDVCLPALRRHRLFSGHAQPLKLNEPRATRRATRVLGTA